jgi:small neutral amino acid transporter SnatA (MarC family)
MGIPCQKKFDLLFHSTIGLCVATGLVSLIYFVLYVRARMKQEEKKEQHYQSIHFFSLFVFVVLGVIILIMMSNMNL